MSSRVVLGNRVTESVTVYRYLIDIFPFIPMFFVILATLWLPKKSKSPQNQLIKRGFLYPGRESNPHVFKGHWILSPARLPIPPPGRELGCKSRSFFSNSKQNDIFFTRKSRKYLQQHSLISITPRKSIAHSNNSSGYNLIQSCTHRCHPHVTLLAKGYERVMKGP